VPADGPTDIATWNPYTATWSRPKAKPVQFGRVGDVPVPGDYDGNGKADYAVWRPSEGNWYVIHSSTGQPRPPVQWGQPGDIPVRTDGPVAAWAAARTWSARLS
jgi:hypothetical protein